MSYRSRGYSSSSVSGVYTGFAILVVAWWILVGLFHAYDPFRSYLYWWNVNPVAMISLNMIFIFGGVALGKAWASDAGDDSFNFFDTVCGIIAALGVVWFIWNMVTYDARVMVALRAETQYLPAEVPINITEFRVSSYAEAQTNFKTQNPDARFQIGKMNYIGDRWIAEFGPKGFFNSIKYPTQGFYEYNPMVNKNPQFINNPMTFAEEGIAGNSLRVLIAKRDPFAYYKKALFAADPDNPGKYMAIVSLTKRRGMDAVPYVSNVVIIHYDGRQEWLDPYQASQDPRLNGLQIIPEWLEYMRVSAYGYQHGVWDSMVYHTDQVQVQTSSTNEENTAPYHMRSGDNMFWVTPMSPYDTPSFVGLAWQQSNDINGPIYVWRVPDRQAYPGIDALTATIKNSSGHPSDVKWLINNGGTLSGETEILEMLPVGHNGQLYFVGYAALGSNPQQTRLFATIRASDSVVMQDLLTAGEVNTWLGGTNELSVLNPTAEAVVTSESLDLSGYSTDQLWDLLDQIMEEIRKRGSTGGNLTAPLNNKISFDSDSDLYAIARSILQEIFSR